MRRKEGDRVGAICGRVEDEKAIRFFGYGEYMGESIPPDGVFSFFGPASKLGVETPRIKLDSGEDVWGCECWFGSENKIQDMLEVARKQGYEIREITPTKYRSECRSHYDALDDC